MLKKIVFPLPCRTRLRWSGVRSRWLSSSQSWEPRTFFTISPWSWKFGHIVVENRVFAAAKLFRFVWFFLQACVKKIVWVLRGRGCPLNLLQSLISE